MKFVWIEELSVGNRIIDSAHKDIFSILNRVDYLIGARDVATLAETFKLLENCLRAYFEIEEKIALAINFDFAEHKLMHHLLLKEFQRIRNILAEKNGMWSDREGEDFTISLAKCIVQHIKDEEKPMKIVLDTLYYDFQPD